MYISAPIVTGKIDIAAEKGQGLGDTIWKGCK